MKVILRRGYRVNLPAGTELDVSEREAARLLAFGVAEKVDDEPPKKAPKKKG